MVRVYGGSRGSREGGVRDTPAGVDSHSPVVVAGNALVGVEGADRGNLAHQHTQVPLVEMVRRGVWAVEVDE